MPPGRRPAGGPIRHQNPTYKFTDYPNVPYDGPRPVDPDPTWPIETQQWWGFVSTMPHCAGWSPTDWMWAKDTGHVHARWTETRSEKWLPELRQREVKMGTTIDARFQIRVRWIDPDGATNTADATVTPIRKIGG